MELFIWTTIPIAIKTGEMAPVAIISEWITELDFTFANLTKHMHAYSTRSI